MSIPYPEAAIISVLKELLDKENKNKQENNDKTIELSNLNDKIIDNKETDNKTEDKKKENNESNNDKAKNVIALKSQDKIKPNVLGISKFEGHVMLLGPTNIGKTTYMITQIGENMFDFVHSVYVGNLNQKENAENFAKMSYSVDAKSVKHFYYDKPNDMNNFSSIYSKPQEEKTLIFFDDAQTTKSFDSIVKYILIAKNSNCQCVVAAHSIRSNQDKMTRNLRESASIYIFFNPLEIDLKTVTQLWTKQDEGNAILNEMKLLSGDNIKRKVIIYSKNLQKFFYGFGKKPELQNKKLNNIPLNTNENIQLINNNPLNTNENIQQQTNV